MKSLEKLKVRAEYSDKYGYSQYQNKVALISHVYINNENDEDMDDLILKISSFPESFKEKIYEIKKIPAGKALDLGEVNIEINALLLNNLTDSFNIDVIMDVVYEGESKSSNFKVEIIPSDTWTGVESQPHLLASFSHRGKATDDIIKRISEILEKNTGSTALESYSINDRKRIVETVNAAYIAVFELGIERINTVTGFSESQKVRNISEILRLKIASNLELALLFSSIFESLGLYPLIVLSEKSAMVAVHLKNDVDKEIVNYDSTYLTKRTASGMDEIILFYAEGAFKGSKMSFNEAKDEADAEVRSDRYLLSIDIKRARLTGVRSNPSKDDEGSISENTVSQEIEKTEEMPIYNYEAADDCLSVEKRWERKLLDLSLRNNLLNFKFNKNSIPLIIHDIATFEDRIASGESTDILPIPKEWEDIIKGNNDENLKKSQIKELSKSEFAAGKVRSLLNESDLDDIAKNISKLASLSIEENGANSLYIALGFLKWYEEKDNKERIAPLILIPVDLKTNMLRKTVKLVPREEDSIFNITLLEMLKQDFGIMVSGLDPLPINENGTDVTRILSIIRDAIINQRGWDVKEEAHLGTFSFKKFVLWADMKSNMETFRKNKIVSSLLERRLTFSQEMEDETKFLEDALKDRRIIYPLSSDYSQSMAVLESAEGKSFVLHGPPGTGKSQTITNIIANALMQEKKVLFVAQKMAALEVVEKRLSDLGIGSFCLELHSNKAKKRDVLNQLEDAVKIVKIKESENFKEIYDKTLEKKKELNSIINSIYEMDESGNSLFSLISLHTKYASSGKIIEISQFSEETETVKAVMALNEMARLGSYVGGPYKHELTGIETLDYTPDLKTRVKELTSFDFSKISEISYEIIEEAGLKSIKEIEAVRDSVKSYTTLSDNIKEIVRKHGVERTESELMRLETALKSYELTKSVLLERFTAGILSIDPARSLADFNDYQSKNIFGKLFNSNKVLKEISSFSKSGKVNEDDVLKILSDIDAYKKTEVEAQEAIKATENPAYILGSTSSKEVYDELNRVKKINEILASVFNKERMSKTSAILFGKSTSNLRSFVDETGDAIETIKEFTELTSFNESIEEISNGNYLRNIAKRFLEISEKTDSLKDWISYNNSKSRAEELKLNDFTRAYAEGRLSEKEMEISYRKSTVRFLLEKKLNEKSNVLKLSGRELAEKVNQLRILIEENRAVEKQELYFRIASRVPDLVKNETTSRELTLLRRAIKSGTKNLSIRSLFNEIPNVLSVLTPCMLMSPMSVAQYLNPDFYNFDLVVFDEASQLPTPEAIGALGRAKEAIIAGDPKQLPPTSFFEVANTEAEFDFEEDLDNILEDALAMDMPERYLTSHYRSRHESLIEFSNRNYYENKLSTFPSPDDLVSKVNLVQVSGTYDRGGTKQNHSEAEAVIDEIERRLMDEELRKKSIGVVTFSKVQQTLIESLLEKRQAENPELSRLLLAQAEPLFIKNLENVQGDERDVILFSVGYGVDEKGKISLNFGPLNQDGGWRRLNVAISRARYEMKIFTNIEPETFNVPEGSARGVSDLRKFLLFAKNNIKTLTLSDVRERSESIDISEDIAERLRELGYKVNTSVGVSDFKLDLAVVHPEIPDRYILGIFCGGSSTQKARSASDRDILYRDVLKGLGWNIENIFVIDYFENPEKEIERIDSLIKMLMRQSNTVSSEENLIEKSQTDETLNEVDQEESFEELYQLANIPEKEMPLDEFMKVSNAKDIAGDLLEIINLESPISLSLLTKRAQKIYGFSRITDRITKQIEMILNPVTVNKPIKVTENDSTVYFKEGSDPKNYTKYRRTLEEDDLRELSDISVTEIKNAITNVVRREGAVSEKMLIKDSLEKLGYPRINAENETLIYRIYTAMLLNRDLEKDNQGYIIISDKSK